MIVSTKGLRPEEVLTALYKHALEYNRQSDTYRTASSSHEEEGIFVRAMCNGHTLPTECFAAHLIRETPALFFGDKVMLDDSSIALNVSLADPDQFESHDFDSLYGVGAAQRAIHNLYVRKGKLLTIQTEREQEQVLEQTGHETTTKSPTSSTPRWDSFRARVGSLISSVTTSSSSPTPSTSLSSSVFSPIAIKKKSTSSSELSAPRLEI